MRRILTTICVMLLAVAAAFAQADKILGTYSTTYEGNQSKVKIFKFGDGYRAQVIWVDKLKDADGKVRTDKKNPDKSKRNTPADKIVLIDKVTYNAEKNCWDGGQVYDPTKGKSFNVQCTFDDAKTLRVKGSWGPFNKSVYWKKID